MITIGLDQQVSTILSFLKVRKHMKELGYTVTVQKRPFPFEITKVDHGTLSPPSVEMIFSGTSISELMTFYKGFVEGRVQRKP